MPESRGSRSILRRERSRGRPCAPRARRRGGRGAAARHARPLGARPDCAARPQFEPRRRPDLELRSSWTASRSRGHAAHHAGSVGVDHDARPRSSTRSGGGSDPGVHRGRLRRARCAHSAACRVRWRRSRDRGRRFDPRVAALDAAVSDAHLREIAPARSPVEHARGSDARHRAGGRRLGRHQLLDGAALARRLRDGRAAGVRRAPDRGDDGGARTRRVLRQGAELDRGPTSRRRSSSSARRCGFRRARSETEPRCSSSRSTFRDSSSSQAEAME